MSYTLKENYETENTGIDASATWPRAQTFTARSSYIFTALSIRVSALTPPGIFSGGIYAVDVDSKPTGASLATFSGSVTASSGSQIWCPIMVLSSGVTLTSGTEYAIVVDYADVDACYWYSDDNVASDGYAGGQSFTKVAGVWTEDYLPNNWADYTFRVYSGKTFTPPAEKVTIHKLVAAANNEIWYEDT